MTKVRILDALGDQRRRAVRIVEDAAGESERGERRRDLVVQIGAQRGGARRLLTRARNGDAPLQVGEETAVIEIGGRAGDGAGAAHDAEINRAFRRRRYFALPSQDE